MEFSPKKATTTKKCCSVPQCSSMAERDRTLSFHTFPKEDETVRVSDVYGNYAATGRRREWARLLGIGKPVSKCMYVCSRHFTADDFRFPDVPAQKRYLKFDAIPSENLPQLPTRGICVQKTRRLDRRKKREPGGSLDNVPCSSMNDEPESSRAAAEAQQVEVKVGWEPLPTVFVKTEVIDAGYEDAREPATGDDAIVPSSYSEVVNAPTRSEADRPDFRFVDVRETSHAMLGRGTDVDPLELPGTPLPETSIKREPPEEMEGFPLETNPLLTPMPDDPQEHAPTDRRVISSSSGSILTCGPVIATRSDGEQCVPATNKSADESNGKETLAFEIGKDAGEKPYACDVGEKPYACDTCDAKFSRASDLSDHSGLHGHEDTYSSGVRKATSTEDSGPAPAHKRLHGKTYSCDVCKATFKQGSNLATHARLHGMKYSCGVCKATFKLSSHLAVHERRLHGKKYSCGVCKATFKLGSHLAVHKRLHAAAKPCS